MRRVILALVLVATPAWADDWTALDDAGITAALTGHKLNYGSATQDFRASGRTLYDAGRPSWGYWAARGNQYCSQWPPADGWACYDVELSGDGNALRFEGESGHVTTGDFID